MSEDVDAAHTQYLATSEFFGNSLEKSEKGAEVIPIPTVVREASILFRASAMTNSKFVSLRSSDEHTTRKSKGGRVK